MLNYEVFNEIPNHEDYKISDYVLNSYDSIKAVIVTSENADKEVQVNNVAVGAAITFYAVGLSLTTPLNSNLEIKKIVPIAKIYKYTFIKSSGVKFNTIGEYDVTLGDTMSFSKCEDKVIRLPVVVA